MASAEDVARPLPETLPDDFGDWDGEGSPAPAPAISDEWDEALGRKEPPKPAAQSDYLEEILESFESKSRVWRSESQAAFVKPPVFVKPKGELGKLQQAAAKRLQEVVEGDAGKKASPVESPVEKPAAVSADRQATTAKLLDTGPDPWPEVSAPVFAKPQKLTIEPAEKAAKPAEEKPQAGEPKNDVHAAQAVADPSTADESIDSSDASSSRARDAANPLIGIFSGGKAEEDEEEHKPPVNKRLVIAVAGACSILLPVILVVTLGHHGAKAAAKPVVQPIAATTESGVDSNATEPMLNAAAGESKPAASKPLTTDEQPAEEKENKSTAPPVTEEQLEMMNDQLEAPRTIPRDAKTQVAESGPPPEAIGPAGADGLGGNGANDAFLKGHGQQVNAVRAKPLAVSSGVASGMLIQKTPPIYPQIAKAARVSGTVELHAVISKNGTITDVQVINGPEMLRQSAIDAVRNWRYRPFKLNNEPVDVETTVNVVFTLGN